MKCEKCGHTVNALSAGYCPVCGASLGGDKPYMRVFYEQQFAEFAARQIEMLLQNGWTAVGEGVDAARIPTLPEYGALLFIVSERVRSDPFWQRVLIAAAKEGRSIVVCDPIARGVPASSGSLLSGTGLIQAVASDLPDVFSALKRELRPNARKEAYVSIPVSPSAPFSSQPSAPHPGSKPGGDFSPTGSTFSPPGGAPQGKKKKESKVDFSVVTDRAVAPGETSVLDVFMYAKGQRRAVEKALEAAKGMKREAERTKTPVRVSRDTPVTVLLFSDDAVIRTAPETQIWKGDALDFQFRFELPNNYFKKSADFICEIYFYDIHVTRLLFSVQCGQASAAPVHITRKDSRKAFVSYSHKDKEQVVDRLLAMQSVAPKLRFWIDSQSLEAGQPWRTEIRTAIRHADVFLLFWSRHSKASPEVEKEWRYALELRRKRKYRIGAGFITPVPLEDPSICPPPEELNSLHFGDPVFDSNFNHIEDLNILQNKKRYKNIRLLN